MGKGHRLKSVRKYINEENGFNRKNLKAVEKALNSNPDDRQAIRLLSTHVRMIGEALITLERNLDAEGFKQSPQK